MPSRRMIGWLLLLLLAPGVALAESMSVGGAGAGGPDPFSSDPFAAAEGAFGIDDPAGDGPAFTGRDVLAILGKADLDRDLPDGFSAGGVQQLGPAPFDQNQNAVGELRLELAGTDGEAAAVWRAYEGPADAVGALPQLAQNTAQRLGTQQVRELHPTIGDDGFTCAVARLAPTRFHAVCALPVSLDPLQTLGTVEATLSEDADLAPMVERAARIAAWARDRWSTIENERRSG
jgi:hypothetical protein